jgi:pSer/pThr/pTyr-binding forkhead associated (FHA) protein
LAKLIVRDRDQTALLDLGPDERLVVGRSHDCDLPVSAERASRHHAEIVPAATGGHLLRDLGSTNGTLLNGAPFPDETSLGEGDIIDVGGCLITYRAQP